MQKFFRYLSQSKDALSLVVPAFKRNRVRVLSGFLAIIAVDIIQLQIPRIIKKAVDGLQESSVTQPELLRYGLMIVALALSIAALRFGWRYLILGFSRILERDLRCTMFSHLLTLDNRFFQKRSTGELMALSSNDLASVQIAFGMGMVAGADAVFMTIATLGFMAYIHPVLTLIAISPMPVLAILTTVLSARLHKRFTKVQEQFSELTEFVRSCLASIRLVKAHTQEKHQSGLFNDMGKEYVRDNIRLAMVQGTLFPFAGLIANTSMLLVIFFGGRYTIEGHITVGEFVAFTSYLFMLTWPMMALGWVTSLFQRGITSLGRISGVLDEHTALTSTETEKLPADTKKLRIQDLTYTYPGQNRPALEKISLEISPGILGVVGRTGSGKSTLCHILARLSPVMDNTVFLENRDINTLSITDFRSRVAYVPQDIILFADTIAANISLGNTDATMDEIQKAAATASIHDEIMEMEEGYQSRIGERGVKLSGGQRQRIALARALLLDRPVLIIDDGLSSVDMDTEQKIIAALSGYIKDRICIIVSHRIAPLVNANTLIVLDQGRIAAQGAHEELLRTNSFYATIHKYQTSFTTTPPENSTEPGGPAR